MSKTADLLILRLISQESPGSASTGWTPLRKMSKAVDPRDTKVLFVPFRGVLENQYRLNYLGRVGDLEFAESRA